LDVILWIIFIFWYRLSFRYWSGRWLSKILV
jgi:hypothetical protein